MSELPVEVMKVDVEGFELAVLKGCSNSLEEWAPVVCVEALSEDRWVEIREFLEDKGYRGFIVLQSDNVGVGFSRLRLLLSGRSWRLAKMPSEFPLSGYPMVYCLSQRHLEMVEA